MYYVGVDLGGTNIAAGVVTDSGELLHQDRLIARPANSCLPIT